MSEIRGGEIENDKSCSTLQERILVQMIKLENLCNEEGYNEQTLNPARRIIKELRETMNVHRVANGMVEYKYSKPPAAELKEFSGYMTKTPMGAEGCEHVWNPITKDGAPPILRWDCIKCSQSKPIQPQQDNKSCEHVWSIQVKGYGAPEGGAFYQCSKCGKDSIEHPKDKELLPCPFCGSEALLLPEIPKVKRLVKCSNASCDAWTINMIIDKWNMRKGVINA